jgi:hypothetical protein
MDRLTETAPTVCSASAILRRVRVHGHVAARTRTKIPRLLRTTKVRRASNRRYSTAATEELRVPRLREVRHVNGTIREPHTGPVGIHGQRTAHHTGISNFRPVHRRKTPTAAAKIVGGDTRHPADARIAVVVVNVGIVDDHRIAEAAASPPRMESLIGS